MSALGLMFSSYMYGLAARAAPARGVLGAPSSVAHGTATRANGPGGSDTFGGGTAQGSRGSTRSRIGRLEGRVALVTGASRGIGRAVAEALASEGARVAINYRGNRALAEELASRIGGIAVGADVSRRDEVRSMVRRVESELGPISVLVNNAGIMEMMSLEEFDDALFRRMMDVNLMGTIYTTLEALEGLKSTHGVVVNVASNAGIGTAIPGSTFYAVSKAAVMALTRRLAFELAPHGIRVNAVAPGWVETDMTVGGRSPEDAEAVRSFFRSRSMLRMTGAPEHIASAVLFLASPDSAYMTGQVLVVDGGRIDYITHGI